MKTQSCKLQKLGALALFFGLVCASSESAHAGPIDWTMGKLGYAPIPAAEPAKPVAAPVAPIVAPTAPTAESEADPSINKRSGLTLAELASGGIVKDFNIRKEGAVYTFTGLVPERCVPAGGFGMDYVYDRAKSAHVVTFKMEHCEGNFKAVPGEKMVALSSKFSPLRVQDENGKLILRSFDGGDPAAAKDLARDEELKDKNNNSLEYVSTAELEKRKLAKERETAKVEKAKKLEELMTKVSSFCKKEDYEGLGKEIAGASELLGSVSEQLDKLGDLKQAKFKKDLAKAKTAEEAADALELYRTAASENGWDENALNESYANKRFELLNSLAEAYKAADPDEKVSQKELIKAVKNWSKEYRDFADRREVKKRQRELGSLLADLGANAGNGGKMEEALAFYDAAKGYVSGTDALKLEGQMTKVGIEQFKACAKNDPAKMKACEDKFVGPAKERAQKMIASIQGKGASASADLAAIQGEYASTFGGGASQTFDDVGTISQQGGALQQWKIQTFQEAQQKAIKAAQEQAIAMARGQYVQTASNNASPGFTGL